MGIIQFLSGLLPLFKEIIFGKRMRATETNEEWEAYNKERKKVLALRIVDYIAASPRLIATLVVLLTLSFIFNVRATQKLLAYTREEKTSSARGINKEHETIQATVPLLSKEQKQQSYIDTIEQIKSVYKEE